MPKQPGKQRPHPTTTASTSKPDESEFPSTTTTPPTTLGPCFPSSSFEPLSQQEYELEFQPSSSERPRLHSLPRRTPPSPVRLGPSLTRSRSPTTPLHPTSSSHPKPPPQLPSVVVEEWRGVAWRKWEIRRRPQYNHLSHYPLSQTESKISRQNLPHQTPLLTQ